MAHGTSQKKPTHPLLYAIGDVLFSSGWFRNIITTFIILYGLAGVVYFLLMLMDVSYPWLTFIFATIILTAIPRKTIPAQKQMWLTVGGERVTLFIQKKNAVGMLEYDSHGHPEGKEHIILLEEGTYFMWWIFDSLTGKHGEEEVSTEAFVLDSGELVNIELNDGIIVAKISVTGNARINDASKTIGVDTKVLKINTQKTLYTQLRDRLEKRSYMSKTGSTPSLHGNLDQFLTELTNDEDLTNELNEVGYGIEGKLRLGVYELDSDYLNAKKLENIATLTNSANKRAATGYQFALDQLSKNISLEDRLKIMYLILGDPKKNMIFWTDLGNSTDPGGFIRAKVLESKGVL